MGNDNLREERNDGLVQKGVEVGSVNKFPLSSWEVAVASSVVLCFLLGLVGVYLTMPESDYSFLKLPRNLDDLQILSSSTAASYGATTSLRVAAAGAPLLLPPQLLLNLSLRTPSFLSSDNTAASATTMRLQKARVSFLHHRNHIEHLVHYRLHNTWFITVSISTSLFVPYETL